MKKLLALFIIIILVLSSCVITAFAEVNTTSTAIENQLVNSDLEDEPVTKPDLPPEFIDEDAPFSKNKFWHSLEYYLDDDNIQLDDIGFEELIFLYDIDFYDQVDYVVFLKYYLKDVNYEPSEEYIRLGDYVMKTTAPQPLMYFYPEDLQHIEYFPCLSTLRDFYEMGCLDNNVLDIILESGVVELVEDIIIGDVNMDADVNIMDATEIQMILAQLKNWSDERLQFIADYDDDGYITVLDATAIQFFLAGLNK